VFSDQQAVDFVRDIQSPQEAAEKLLQESLARGTTDNLTVMVIRFHTEYIENPVEKPLDSKPGPELKAHKTTDVPPFVLSAFLLGHNKDVCFSLLPSSWLPPSLPIFSLYSRTKTNIRSSQFLAPPMVGLSLPPVTQKSFSFKEILLTNLVPTLPVLPSITPNMSMQSALSLLLVLSQKVSTFRSFCLGLSSFFCSSPSFLQPLSSFQVSVLGKIANNQLYKKP